jgi:hypothetical protein
MWAIQPVRSEYAPACFTQSPQKTSDSKTQALTQTYRNANSEFISRVKKMKAPGFCNDYENTAPSLTPMHLRNSFSTCAWFMATAGFILAALGARHPAASW